MDPSNKWLKSSLKYVHCSQLPLHSGKTCFQSYLHDFYRFSISSMKYFSPLILTPLALKGKAMSVDKFKDTLRFYLETALASSTVGSLIFGLSCVFRNFCGEDHIWKTLLIPGYIAGQCCWFFPKRSQRIFIMATSQVVLEGILRQYKNAFTYFLLNSKTLHTLIFMMSSSIIMHYKRLHIYSGFWFVTPEENNARNTDDREQKLQQPESFSKYLLKECKTYFAYGLSLDVLNTIIKQYSSNNSKGLLKTLWATLRGLHFKMTAFFVAYIGIYKVVLRYIHTLLPGALSPNLQHAIAAFLGGASYAFLNKLTVNTFALILAVQIVWHCYCEKLTERSQSSIFLNVLKNIPFSHILLPFNVTYITNVYVLNNSAINSMGTNLVDAITDQKIRRFLNYLNKYDVDYIIKDACQKPILAAF